MRRERRDFCGIRNIDRTMDRTSKRGLRRRRRRREGEKIWVALFKSNRDQTLKDWGRSTAKLTIDSAGSFHQTKTAIRRKDPAAKYRLVVYRKLFK